MGFLSWLTNLNMGGSAPQASQKRKPVVIRNGQLQQLQSDNLLDLGPYQLPPDIGGKLQYLTVPGATTVLKWSDSSLYQTSRDPLTSDGASDGFSKGSHWLNTDDNRLWICVDPTDGTSVWRAIYRREDDYLALSPSAGVGGTDNQTLRIGPDAETDKYGQVAQASGSFSQQGDAQISKFVMRNSTTNNTPTEVRLDGDSARLTVPTGTAWAVKITAIASDQGAACTATWAIEGLIANNLGTTRYSGPGSTGPDQTLDYDGGSTDPTTWLIQPSADDTNDALAVTVTGQASVDIRWVVQVVATEVFNPVP